MVPDGNPRSRVEPESAPHSAQLLVECADLAGSAAIETSAVHQG